MGDFFAPIDGEAICRLSEQLEVLASAGPWAAALGRDRTVGGGRSTGGEGAKFVARSPAPFRRSTTSARCSMLNEGTTEPAG